MNILDSKGKTKTYIYRSDIRKYIGCSSEYAGQIFTLVKEFELQVLAIEMFENRVPQELFHEFRKKRRN